MFLVGVPGDCRALPGEHEAPGSRGLSLLHCCVPAPRTGPGTQWVPHQCTLNLLGDCMAPAMAPSHWCHPVTSASAEASHGGCPWLTQALPWGPEWSQSWSPGLPGGKGSAQGSQRKVVCPRMGVLGWRRRQRSGRQRCPQRSQASLETGPQPSPSALPCRASVVSDSKAAGSDPRSLSEYVSNLEQAFPRG